MKVNISVAITAPQNKYHISECKSTDRSEVSSLVLLDLTKALHSINNACY